MEENKRKEMEKKQLVMGCIVRVNFWGCLDMGWSEKIVYRAFGEADFSKNVRYESSSGKILKTGHF